MGMATNTAAQAQPARAESAMQFYDGRGLAETIRYLDGMDAKYIAADYAAALCGFGGRNAVGALIYVGAYKWRGVIWAAAQDRDLYNEGVDLVAISKHTIKRYLQARLDGEPDEGDLDTLIDEGIFTVRGWRLMSEERNAYVPELVEYVPKIRQLARPSPVPAQAPRQGQERR